MSYPCVPQQLTGVDSEPFPRFPRLPHVSTGTSNIFDTHCALYIRTMSSQRKRNSMICCLLQTSLGVVTRHRYVLYPPPLVVNCNSIHVNAEAATLRFMYEVTCLINHAAMRSLISCVRSDVIWVRLAAYLASIRWSPHSGHRPSPQH